jgi:hypothetical protein
MKLKLTYNQFTSLFAMLNVALQDRPVSMQDKLIYAIMVCLHKKIYRMAVDVKNKYSLKLTSEEAIAFWLYYQEKPLAYTSMEGNLINIIWNNIDQKFA